MCSRKRGRGRNRVIREDKMKGLKKAAGETKRCQRNGYGHSFQINYDPETKEIWTDEFVSSRSFVPY